VRPSRSARQCRFRIRIRNGASAQEGRRIDVSLTISPIKDATGNVVGGSKIARDISQRKRDEEKLAELTQSLAEKNKELEAIVYVASARSAIPAGQYPGLQPGADSHLRSTAQNSRCVIRRHRAEGRPASGH